MSISPPGHDEIATLGREIYDHDLRSSLEPAHRGAFIVIDVATRDYELDDDPVDAFDRLSARRPNLRPYFHRVGFPTTFRLGRHFRAGETR